MIQSFQDWKTDRPPGDESRMFNAAMSNAPQHPKNYPRTELRAAWKTLSAADRAAASLQLCALLEKQTVWQSARTILFFAPLADEPDIWPLLADSLAAGKTVLLPRFELEHGHYVAAHITDIERDL